jgi:hypothetical protein
MDDKSTLDLIAEKIDFSKLTGKPEDFYQAGVAFVENGQFDNGILEFVKVIKISLPATKVYELAVKELKRMGFNDKDILGKDHSILPVNTVSESVKVVSTERKNDASKLPGMILVGIGLFFAFLLFTDTNGLDFLNYCLPTLAFLVLGSILLMLSGKKR